MVSLDPLIVVADLQQELVTCIRFAGRCGILVSVIDVIHKFPLTNRGLLLGYGEIFVYHSHPVCLNSETNASSANKFVNKFLL
jgi:hypothetical protein